MDGEYVFNVTFDDFEQRVINSPIPVLVDFWAEWCAPCLVIAPVLESVVNEFAGRVYLAKLEVDEGENMKLAGKHKVRGFPTIILFSGGKEISRFSSARPRQFIVDFIRGNIQGQSD